MPVRRGHVAPPNIFIDTIIRKFDGQSKYIPTHFRFYVVIGNDCHVTLTADLHVLGFPSNDFHVLERYCTITSIKKMKILGLQLLSFVGG